MINFLKVASKLSPIWLSVYGVSVLTVAYIFQYGFGYLPCKLCLYQRLPWLVVVILGGIAFLKPEYGRFFIRFAISTLAFGATLAAFHAGMEYGLWQGVKVCSGVVPLAKDSASLLKSLHTKTIPSCNVASWTLFGISMAGYNALLSIDACLFACILSKRDS